MRDRREARKGGPSRRAGGRLRARRGEADKLHMPIARIAAEQLLLFLFRIAGLAFLFSAVATGGAFVAVLPLQGPDAPEWLGILARAWMTIAGTFLVTGILVFAARPADSTRGGEEGHPGRTAAALLGLSL